MILIGIVITSVLYWATTNVCRYNFVIEKKTNEMNIIAAEIKPEIKLGEVYYFKDLSIALGQTDRIPLALSIWAPIIALSLFTFIGVLQINEK